MNFTNQSLAIEQLADFAQRKVQSVLISGPSGSGKTHIASLYQSLVGASEFWSIDPNVNSIKDTIEYCIQSNITAVCCIENLDIGSINACNTILKFLEEPQSGIFIIVTCHNIGDVPNTIVSRCTTISLSNPTHEDLIKYMEHKFHISLLDNPLYNAAISFSDVDCIYMLKQEYCEYILESIDILSEPSISTQVWNLTHFPDSSNVPLKILFQCLLYYYKSINDTKLSSLCVSILEDISDKRIASHIPVTKFCMAIRYGI